MTTELSENGQIKQYLILLSAVVKQLCLGATYSWSVYVQQLTKLTGFLQGPVQLLFSIFYFVWVRFMPGSFYPTFHPLWRR